MYRPTVTSTLSLLLICVSYDYRRPYIIIFLEHYKYICQKETKIKGLAFYWWFAKRYAYAEHVSGMLDKRYS